MQKLSLTCLTLPRCVKAGVQAVGCLSDRAHLTRGLAIGQQLSRIFDVGDAGMRWFVGVVQGHIFSIEEESGHPSLSVVVHYEDGDVEELSVRSADFVGTWGTTRRPLYFSH